MARDRLLPARLARIGGREVPPAAVALTFVGAGLLVFLTIETIAIIASLAFLGLFSFVHASVVALRRGERRSAPGFRVPLVPAVPMGAIALNLALGALLWNYPSRSDAPIPPGMLATILGALWLVIGLAYHWSVGRRRPRLSPTPATVTEVHDILTTGEERVELERYRVFLPLREFEDRTLVDLGARVARAERGAEPPARRRDPAEPAAEGDPLRVRRRANPRTPSPRADRRGPRRRHPSGRENRTQGV